MIYLEAGAASRIVIALDRDFEMLGLAPRRQPAAVYPFLEIALNRLPLNQDRFKCLNTKTVERLLSLPSCFECVCGDLDRVCRPTARLCPRISD